jgi:ATP-dependent RNA helicase RhlE
VINYDIPNIPETYIHRIGRTGRALASGSAASFCDTDERPYVQSIQKLIKQQIEVVSEHPFLHETTEELPASNAARNGNSSNTRKPGENRPRNRDRRHYAHR